MFASKDVFLASPSGYTISRSVRLRSSASAYFNRTPASAGNRQKFTWSAWFKRGVMSDANLTWLFGAGVTDETNIYIRDTDIFELRQVTSGAEAWKISTTQVFRDPSSWYHFVVAFDTTQATASNRIKIYVNGVQVTAFSTANYPSQNFNTEFNNTSGQYIGKRASSSAYCDGYFTEINVIDGQQLTPSSFGTTNALTGVWQPAKYTGTYGTNGFYLNFSNNSSNTATTIGKDYSGNGNNWTPNNISVTAGATYDSMLDVPTPYADGGNGRGNYAVLNPLNAPISGFSISNGNLSVSSSNASWASALSSVGMSSGKWYCEGTVIAVGTNDVFAGGLTTTYQGLSYPGSIATSYGYIGSTGNKYNNASSSAYGATYTTNDVIGVAFDADAGTLTFYKNGTSQGTAFTGLTSGPYYFAFSGTSNSNIAANFGQRPFTYTPPTGFVALNTQNLPDSTIKNGAAYMAASLYTGTLLSNSIVNSGNNAGAISFKPDLVWIKSRSAATDHKLTDSVRGVTKALISDTTGAETTDAQGLTAFNSNGFTVGTDTNYNNLSATYVAWQWQAGAGSSSSNTNGSITSTVSVGATQGFSVVTYTANNTAGATVGHGLGVAPSFIIVKSRNNVNSWNCYHSSLGNTQGIDLNGTGAASANSAYWNNTSPTSNVFTVSTYTNNSTFTYVAYCFAAVKGFSAFGSYTGNGSTDGPFIYTGFRPRYVLVKCSSSVFEWWVQDTSRSTYNVSDTTLFPNNSNAEAAPGSGYSIDILSNGFKCRAAGGSTNGSGNTYIYACFAENPFRNALAR